MKNSRQVIKWCLLFMTVLLIAGCSKQTQVMSDGDKIYFYDTSRDELVGEALGSGFYACQSEKEQVEYIIDLLKNNKSLQAATFQLEVEMPIDSVTINDRVIQVHFNEGYETLTAEQRIGMQASIVYSLTELKVIDGVEFFVNDMPLTTATGQTVGVLYRSDILRNVLQPYPATTLQTLVLYFANADGKLVKEEHSIQVSDTSNIEKLVIEELIKGPNQEGCVATLPSDVKIKDVKIASGVCQVDLSFDLKSKFFTSNDIKKMMIYSIVNSLTELPNIKKVTILVDGKSDIEFTPDIDLRDTFERSEELIENQK